MKNNGQKISELCDMKPLVLQELVNIKTAFAELRKDVFDSQKDLRLEIAKFFDRLAILEKQNTINTYKITAIFSAIYFLAQIFPTIIKIFFNK